MLETLLMLPIHLIMLSGLFWLGEMCLARAAFVGAENLRLWESGLRYAFTAVGERNLFFLRYDSNVVGELVSNVQDLAFARSSGPQLGGWGQVVSGRSSVNTLRSTWSETVDKISLLALRDDDSTSPKPDLSIQTVFDLHLLKRVDYNGRMSIYNAGRNDLTAWKNEYGARWILGGTTISMPSGGTAQSVSLYNGGNRNANYNRWSQ